MCHPESGQFLQPLSLCIFFPHRSRSAVCMVFFFVLSGGWKQRRKSGSRADGGSWPLFHAREAHHSSSGPSLSRSPFRWMCVDCVRDREIIISTHILWQWVICVASLLRTSHTLGLSADLHTPHYTPIFLLKQYGVVARTELMQITYFLREFFNYENINNLSVLLPRLWN